MLYTISLFYNRNTKVVIVLFLTMLFGVQGYAQAPVFVKEWATYTNNYQDTLIHAGINTGVLMDQENNVYLTRSISGPQENATLGSLSKFSPEGELLWTTPNYGEAKGLVIDRNGDIVFGGYTSREENIATEGAFQENKGYARDAFLMKFNPEGERLWGTYFGGDGNDMEDDYVTLYYMGLEVTPDNQIIWSCGMNSEDMGTNGTFQSQRNGANWVLSKFDTNGQREWTTYYGSSESEKHNISGLKLHDSGIFINGRVQNNMQPSTYYDTSGNYIFEPESYEIYLTKFDYNGNRIWSRYLPKGNGKNHMRRYGLIINEDNLYITYTTTSTDLGTEEGAFPYPITGSVYPGILMKLGLEGDIHWSSYLPDNNYPVAYSPNSVYSDPDGGIYIMGSTIATDYDFMEGLSSSNQGSSTHYLLKFNDEGDILWGRYLGESNNVEMSNFGVAIGDNVLYLYGTTNGSFNIATQGAFQEESGGITYSTFLAKYKDKSLDIETHPDLSLKIFPNPTAGVLNIHLGNDNELPMEAIFYNVLGQIVKTEYIREMETPIDLSGFDSGVYFFELKWGVKRLVKRIVVK